jgi:putative MATE family efflux protein
MKDKRIHTIGTLPVNKAIINMAIPSIVGMQVAAFYNIIDTMFVSWLGTEATGTTQIVLPMVMIISAIGLTFGVGGASYISRLLGENKIEDANRVSATSFYLSLATGIGLTLFGITFISPILSFFGATDRLMPYALDYGFYIIVGTSAQMMNITMNNLLRAEGSSKITMYAMIIGAVLNIFLDPIFIFKMNLGIKGAAIATMLSQYITTLILVRQYVTKKTLLTIYFKLDLLKKHILNEIIKIGLPTFARQLLTGLSLAFLNQGANLYGGTVGIAAIGIVTRTMMIVFYIIFGLSQGFQPVAGYSYGAQNYNRLRNALYFTIKASLSVAIISGIIYLKYAHKILVIYKPSSQVLEVAIEFGYYFVISLIFMSFTNVLSVYYQAIGRSKPALLLSISRQGLFFIPFILILPNYFSLKGVFIAQPLADFFTLIISLYFFTPSKRLFNKPIAESN